MPEPMSPGAFNANSPADGKSISQRIGSLSEKVPSWTPYFVIGTGVIALTATLVLLFFSGKDNSPAPPTPENATQNQNPQDADDQPVQNNADKQSEPVNNAIQENQTEPENNSNSNVPAPNNLDAENQETALPQPDDGNTALSDEKDTADDPQHSDNETETVQPDENPLNPQPADEDEVPRQNDESDTPPPDNSLPADAPQPADNPQQADVPDEDNPFQEIEQNDRGQSEPNEPVLNDAETDGNGTDNAENDGADNNADIPAGADAHPSPIPGLDIKLNSISIRETKLSQCLQTIRELGALPIEVNWDSLRRNGVNADDKISWSGKDVTVQQALSEVLAQRGLTFKINDEGKIVFAAQSSLNARSNPSGELDGGSTSAMVKTPYSVSDLVGQSPEKTADLIKTIRDFLCPGDWKEVGGTGTINSSGGGSVMVLQSRQNQWIIADFLDRLRLARRLAPLYNPDASLEPMSVRAQSALKRNVGINFQPTADLKTALTEIGRRIGVNILLDEPSLKLAGISVQFPISFDARAMTLDEAFARLGEETGLVSLAQTPNSFLVTTPQGAKTVMGVEFYPISDLISLGLTPTILMEQIVKFEPASWKTQDAARCGLVRFDPGSDCLIVRQSPAVLAKITELLNQLRNRLKEANK